MQQRRAEVWLERVDPRPLRRHTDVHADVDHAVAVVQEVCAMRISILRMFARHFAVLAADRAFTREGNNMPISSA